MSTTMHSFTPEEIMAFLDGELSTDPVQSLSTHLGECIECQDIVTSFRKTAAALSHWAVPAVPTQLEASVAAAATKNSTSSERLPSTTPWRLGRRNLRRSTLALVGTAALFLLGIAVSIPALNHRREAGLHVAEHGRQQAEIDKKKAPATFTDRIEAGGKKPNSLVTLVTPGAVADSNGMFHGLGDHVQDSFSVNGQPITDQQSRVFTGPMIARTVSLSLVVKDFDPSRAGLDAILARHDGHSANLTVNTPQGAPRSLQASLRVPTPQLAATISELKALGRVEIETQSGEEVTRQHADLVARLKVSRETERRFLAILRERTGDVNQVLNAEQAIARVRGEIEQMEAEQKNIEHRVDFATIDLNLAEEYKAQLTTPAPSVVMQLRNATINGFRNAFESLLALVLFLAESGPSLLLWLTLLGVPAWRLWRRYRRARALGSLVGA
jgi:acetolactate synthase small subunit